MPFGLLPQASQAAPRACLYECTMEFPRAAGTDLTKAFLWESIQALSTTRAIILDVPPSRPGFSFLIPHEDKFNWRVWDDTHFHAPESPLWTFVNINKVGEFVGSWLDLVIKNHRAMDMDDLIEGVDRHFLFEEGAEDTLAELNYMAVSSTYDKICKALNIWIAEEKDRVESKVADLSVSH